jgi:hypothetical protein
MSSKASGAHTQTHKLQTKLQWHSLDLLPLVSLAGSHRRIIRTFRSPLEMMSTRFSPAFLFFLMRPSTRRGCLLTKGYNTTGVELDKGKYITC